jgi:hypothetical protein
MSSFAGSMVMEQAVLDTDSGNFALFVRRHSQKFCLTAVSGSDMFAKLGEKIDFISLFGDCFNLVEMVARTIRPAPAWFEAMRTPRTKAADLRR